MLGWTTCPDIAICSWGKRKGEGSGNGEGGERLYVTLQGGHDVGVDHLS